MTPATHAANPAPPVGSRTGSQATERGRMIAPMPKIAFLFPGQGAQFVGMGRELYAELPAVRTLFDRAGEILGIDLEGPLFRWAGRGPQCDRRQPARALRGQPGGAREPESNQSRCRVRHAQGAAGLSLGEYTALVFAGSIDFEAGLKLVRLRGEAMQAAAVATKSGMASVLGLDENKVDELCGRVEPFGRLWKANLLGPGNIVVSGDAAALEQVESIAAELGAMKVIRLAVAGAFHCPLMKPADQQLAAVSGADRNRRTAPSGLLERRRDAACRARRHSSDARFPGSRGGALGSLDAQDDGRRIRHIL